MDTGIRSPGAHVHSGGGQLVTQRRAYAETWCVFALVTGVPGIGVSATNAARESRDPKCSVNVLRCHEEEAARSKPRPKVLGTCSSRPIFS